MQSSLVKLLPEGGTGRNRATQYTVSPSYDNVSVRPEPVNQAMPDLKAYRVYPHQNATCVLRDNEIGPIKHLLRSASFLSTR